MADSLRDALLSAMDEEKPDPVSTPEVPETPVVPNTEEPAPLTSGEKESPKPDDNEPAPVAPKDEGNVSSQEPAKKEAPAPEEKPPASWKPEAKTTWGNIPGAARAEIARREQETARVLTASTEARKFTQSFEQVITPFKPLLEKYQVSPLAAVENLMGIRARLEMGTPEQKAELLCNIINDFKVDIELLDGMLVNPKARPAPIPQFDPTQIPAFRPLFDLQAQIQQAKEKKVEQQISKISSHPRYEELKEDTADILELAAKRGRAITIEQAFDQALQLNGEAPMQKPAISPSQAGAALAAAKKAGAAVSGAPRGAPAAKPDSLRDTIAQAFG